MIRQGDIYIESVPRIPEEAVELDNGILIEGELTGHHHQIDDLVGATALVLGDRIFVQVIGPQVGIVHPEHSRVELPNGLYRVWRQREFSPTRSFGVGSHILVRD